MGEELEAGKNKGLIEELKQKSRSALRKYIEAGKYNWDKLKPLLDKLYSSADRISKETPIPFTTVAETRVYDFFEPTSVMAPFETRTISSSKFKKYGLPPEMGWLNAVVLFKNLMSEHWVGEMGKTYTPGEAIKMWVEHAGGK